MDAQQEKAFRTALSTRLSLIQGPPGTGKTYIGAVIAKFLLSNDINERTGPIILTCYTNHALDQFLTKIMENQPPGAVIRLGGNSKDEAIQKLSISSVARELKEYPPRFSKTIKSRDELLEKCIGLKKTSQKFERHSVFDTMVVETV